MMSYLKKPKQDGISFFECKQDKETFVIKLLNEKTIDRARALVKRRGEACLKGKIIRMPRLYNLPWGFHLDPASIDICEKYIEVCDASIKDVQTHLKEIGKSFLPKSLWCPWNVRITKEIRLQEILERYEEKENIQFRAL